MFNYTTAMEAVLRRAIANVEAFAHVDLERLLIAWTPCRGGSPHGTFAKVVPLRFADGARTTRIGRRTYRMPYVEHEGREILYLIYFYLPRFQDLGYRDKLITVLHELYHVAPEFNGDIRRFPGKNFAHGSSRKKYNEMMARFADELDALAGDHADLAFLRHTYEDLQRTHGTLVGRRVRLPRPERVHAPNAR